MTVTSESKVFYTTNELAQRMQVAPEKIDKIIIEKNLDRHHINGVFCIKQDNLEGLIQELLLSLDISYKYYEIPEYLKNCTSPWAQTLVQMYENKITYPASISPSQGSFLRSLVNNVAPKNIVEIGCFTGVSTIWLASALEELGEPAIVHSVDLFVDILPILPHLCGYLTNPFEYAQKSVENAQLSHRVKFYKNNSREIGEKIYEILDEPIDFLFIDGDHTIEGCYNDFILYYPHVADGGYIILHDIYPEYCDWNGPRYLIDKFIKKSPYFELLEIKTSPVNYGMAVIRKLGTDKNLELLEKFRKTTIWQKFKDRSPGKLLKNRFFNEQ